MTYQPDPERYNRMIYNRCGKSGLKLPAVSLGMWHNFGTYDNLANMTEMIHTAFDHGITHFDLANNYGPEPGAAEENFGRILARDMMPYRDELCISTKAGYEMWEGPYGNRNGSRKYLTASLDQSLKRMGLEYVDIFYHHVYDPETPLEETALALDNAVRQGKALYVGISNYNKTNTEKISAIFKELKTPFIINQPSYSMLNRYIEKDGLYDYARDTGGIGLIAFSPLYQGLLTDKYLHGIPHNSRAEKHKSHCANQLDDKTRIKLIKLNELAKSRGQKLAQMAVSWILRDNKVTSVLIGASSPAQILENIEAIHKTSFTDAELQEIEKILNE